MVLQVCLFCVFAEKLNSFAATERSFTIKMFTFQFFTLFSSLFYVAFFLGRYCVSAEGQLLIYIGEDFLIGTVTFILPAWLIFKSCNLHTNIFPVKMWRHTLVCEHASFRFYTISIWSWNWSVSRFGLLLHYHIYMSYGVYS